MRDRLIEILVIANENGNWYKYIASENGAGQNSIVTNPFFRALLTTVTMLATPT